jgi:anti-sigma regulatory factor (Ser/Thr protein kinase)
MEKNTGKSNFKSRMNSANKKLSRSVPEIKTGLFSKQEGAEAIISNFRHVHSSLLGKSDPCWKMTESKLKDAVGLYPWEISQLNEFTLTQSKKRSECVELIASTTQFGSKSQNRERLTLVMEELLSNAFYHAYKIQANHDKYERLSPVTLASGEEIRVSFGENSNGLHLAVEDQGGTLSFEDFKNCFSRCFHRTKTDITFDKKHSGAGLGLYLIYEVTTHLNIFVEQGKKTRFSLWLSNTNQFDPDSFSFNFFGE